MWQKVSALCKGQVYIEVSDIQELLLPIPYLPACTFELFYFFIVYSFLIKIMFQGNIEQFIKFTGWYGPNVLYFGDHVYSDLRVSWIVCNCFQFYINILT